MISICICRERGTGATYTIPQPIGSSGESNTASTDWKRERLANDDPSTWTPSGGEEENVDANKGYFCFDGLGVASIHSTSDGDDEFAHKHAKSAPNEQRAATKSLNSVEGD